MELATTWQGAAGATSRTGGKGPRQAKGKESKKRFVRPEGKTTEPKPPRKAREQGEGDSSHRINGVCVVFLSHPLNLKNC